MASLPFTTLIVITWDWQHSKFPIVKYGSPNLYYSVLSNMWVTYVYTESCTGRFPKVVFSLASGLTILHCSWLMQYLMVVLDRVHFYQSEAPFCNCLESFEGFRAPALSSGQIAVIHPACLSVPGEMPQAHRLENGTNTTVFTPLSNCTCCFTQGKCKRWRCTVCGVMIRL